jgi:hypothetical protein
MFYIEEERSISANRLLWRLLEIKMEEIQEDGRNRITKSFII